MNVLSLSLHYLKTAANYPAYGAQGYIHIPVKWFKSAATVNAGYDGGLQISLGILFIMFAYDYSFTLQLHIIIRK